MLKIIEAVVNGVIFLVPHVGDISGNFDENGGFTESDNGTKYRAFFWLGYMAAWEK